MTQPEDRSELGYELDEPDPANGDSVSPYGYPAAPPAQFQQPYPPPGYPQWGPPRPTNGMAIASMVLGIIWIYWIGSILALIFGYVARNQIRERGEGGDGMAIAGIVLGWVGVGILAIFLGGSLIAYLSDY